MSLNTIPYRSIHFQIYVHLNAAFVTKHTNDWMIFNIILKFIKRINVFVDTSRAGALRAQYEYTPVKIQYGHRPKETA